MEMEQVFKSYTYTLCTFIVVSLTVYCISGSLLYHWHHEDNSDMQSRIMQ